GRDSCLAMNLGAIRAPLSPEYTVLRRSPATLWDEKAKAGALQCARSGAHIGVRKCVTVACLPAAPVPTKRPIRHFYIVDTSDTAALGQRTARYCVSRSARSFAQ